MRQLLRVLQVLVLFTLVAARVQAQSTPQRAAFEVASIKLNKNCGAGAVLPRISPGGITLPCLSVRILIRLAYSAFNGADLNARLMQVLNGPGWIDTDRYDISAKPEAKASAAEMAPMLQTLLEDRFNLKVHKEPRDTPVYELTVAEQNPKLRPSKDGDCIPIDLTNLSGARPKPGDPAPNYCGGGRMRMSGDVMSADWVGITMAELAGRMLPAYVDRPVVDRTGLTGRFNVHLEFVPPRPVGPIFLNGQEMPAPAPGAEAPAEPSGPSIFTALQKQLGLRLSPGKDPLDVIVVDRVERPSEN
ncbi:MAG: TIGR03435 family protein [Bryobacteraceae bacterium]